MAKKDELMAEEVASEPQKKRTRIAKKDTSDHVYSVSGDKGENLDQAKKKRTRTKKTEAKSEAVETAAELPVEAPAEQVVEAVAEPVAEAAAELLSQWKRRQRRLCLRNRKRRLRRSLSSVSVAASLRRR